MPRALSHLPPPDAQAQATSARLAAAIADGIEAGGGFLPFDRYMALALHAPGLGYYSAGSRKLGPDADFVTAPELTPLFAHTLAAQVGELIARGFADVLELGAGSGRLASDLLAALDARGALPARYAILETSADLRERQQALLQREHPAHAGRIEWLDGLPERFRGVVLANEVLDAMPVALVHAEADTLHELGVSLAPGSGTFEWRMRPAAGELLAAMRALELAPGTTTEIHLAARAFMRTLGTHLECGAALFIDYGFPRREYYHPERRGGTLMCHFRQHAHADPLVLVGLQDITAHLDFSALGEAARAGGLAVLGYASQAQFLINCGITDVLAGHDPADAARYAPIASAAQRLLSPAEMGELFKVLAVGRGVEAPLVGFRSGDRSDRLG